MGVLDVKQGFHYTDALAFPLLHETGAARMASYGGLGKAREIWHA